MTGDQAGLLVLAGTLVVATAGAWDLLAAGAARQELRSGPPASAPSRC